MEIKVIQSFASFASVLCRSSHLRSTFVPTLSLTWPCHDHRPRSYDGCIVHGLMVAGLFSTAFGRAISGALYVSQSLR